MTISIDVLILKKKKKKKISLFLDVKFSTMSKTPNIFVGFRIYGTDVDDIIMTSLFVPLGMLNATLPIGVTYA